MIINYFLYCSHALARRRRRHSGGYPRPHFSHVSFYLLLNTRDATRRGYYCPFTTHFPLLPPPPPPPASSVMPPQPQPQRDSDGFLMPAPPSKRTQLRPANSLPTTADIYAAKHGIPLDVQMALQSVGRRGRESESHILSQGTRDKKKRTTTDASR